jgi:hypothetical protein
MAPEQTGKCCFSGTNVSGYSNMHAIILFISPLLKKMPGPKRFYLHT